MTASAAAAEAVATAVAAERPAIVATLIRMTQDWDLAEDSAQDAVEKALRTWPEEGLPRSPGAWLTTVARRRALDVLRRRQNERTKLQEAAMLEDPAATQRSDDLLRLIFTCCHPALALDSRVALTLKTVAGLSTPEIARAFLLPEATLSQRLLRTKKKIAHAGIPYRVPDDDVLAERISGVLAVIYLIFNEGYTRQSDHLALESRRLARLLVDLMPTEDEARSLLALITFQIARRATRFDSNGQLVPMEEQDRSRWDRVLIDEASWHLRRAAHDGRPPGTFRLQAEIAQRHAQAPSADATDWAAIVPLYDALLVAQPSPVIGLNRAIAVGFRDGFEAGLRELDAIDQGALSSYVMLPATRADFLRRLGRLDEARSAYDEAIALTAPDQPERELLERRRAEIDAG
ncbi:RNA polymerase sigma factor [Luteipulveratus mongoliensis]|uniref:ECF subfamily RNA polymerase sigma-24 subunit n=1 Tax=Luteipulveratus mongoliensis TaxID=571913 RepID=A0A0K1JEH2_9MICO|nr:sigma-70 family RNA polymerase sigma factor [Luteipulveratus mongoliensis]AKU15099.1 ECF subfamily RNA polymerase sigma-24 subunit [Luteipulveratus mongoliensis]